MDALQIRRLVGLIYSACNLEVIAIGAVAAVVLWAVIYHTKFGVLLRATSQDRRMASALGLNVGLVYVVAFGIGCFMAGPCGGLLFPTPAGGARMGVGGPVISLFVLVIRRARPAPPGRVGGGVPRAVVAPPL